MAVVVGVVKVGGKERGHTNYMYLDAEAAVVFGRRGLDVAVVVGVVMGGGWGWGVTYMLLDVEAAWSLGALTLL